MKSKLVLVIVLVLAAPLSCMASPGQMIEDIMRAVNFSRTAREARMARAKANYYPGSAGYYAPYRTPKPEWVKVPEIWEKFLSAGARVNFRVIRPAALVKSEKAEVSLRYMSGSNWQDDHRIIGEVGVSSKTGETYALPVTHEFLTAEVITNAKAPKAMLKELDDILKSLGVRLTAPSKAGDIVSVAMPINRMSERQIRSTLERIVNATADDAYLIF